MTVDLPTLTTAVAALVISVAALLHQIRQRRNEIRPLLVVIERPVSSGSDALCLYLVNMGNAAAIDVEVSWAQRPPDLSPPAVMQAAVAPGRRMALAAPYHGTRLHEVGLKAGYRDLDGRDHTTTYAPPRAAGGRTHTFATRWSFSVRGSRSSEARRGAAPR